MDRPIKPVLFAIIVIAATASVAYVLNMLDQIVHGQLYHYGLQFSLDWANPYWNLLRIIQILLGIIAASTAINAILAVRKYFFVEKPSLKAVSTQRPAITFQSPTHATSTPKRSVSRIRHPVDRNLNKPVASPPTPVLTTAPSPSVPSTMPAPKPKPSPTPAATPNSSEITALTRCSHCGKAFTQPLRMLDFQGDRPRIVNICPFCNEIITASTR